MTDCFLCDDKKAAEGWDKESLGFVLRQMKLCTKHKTELEAKLPGLPESQEDPPLKTVPAKQPTAKPDSQQRAAGERETGEEG